MGKRILVVEPSPTLRGILEMELQRQQHQVVLFENYAAAVQAFPRFQTEPPDVALVALDSESAESVQVVMRLRAMFAQTLLIMMTIQEEGQQLIVQRIRGTIQAILLIKPFSIKDVLRLVAGSVPSEQ
ncbi:MAG: response regulator [Ktedonobacteraceae bacterium]|nr:response regulator [Ktedonobacteraceae bacterium]